MPDSPLSYVNRNLEIKRLPAGVDKMLSTLAHLKGCTKADVIREALIEYVDRHRPEAERLVKGLH